jgi:adenylylsulfate kinase-like enzyme
MADLGFDFSIPNPKSKIQNRKMLIHLNGMPGVGKLTVAKQLAEKLKARLVDNHLVIDLVLSLCERGTPEYTSLIRKFTDVVLAEIATKPDQTFIFTNALATEIAEDRKRVEQLSQFAQDNDIPFVQVFLACDLEENKRRVVSADRKLKSKLMDSDELEKLFRNYTIYHPPAEFAMTIDTTTLSAEEVSQQIKNYTESITKP